MARSTTHRTPTEAAADRRVEAADQIQPYWSLPTTLVPAAPAPTGAAPTADPTPAGVPGDAMGMAPESSDAGAASQIGAGSDVTGAGRPRDERGRFIGASRPLVPRPGAGGVELGAESLPVSVALEHALIDADAALFLAEQHHRLRMARVLVGAIAFGVEADRAEIALAVKAGMLVRLGSDGGDAP